MHDSTAIVATKHASRYLQQLCKHFGHKVPTEYTENTGHIALPFGTCRLSASGDALTMTVQSEFADLTRTERVIGDHLARFAFRETPRITWQRAA